MKEKEAHEKAAAMSAHGLNATVIMDKWGEFDGLLWEPGTSEILLRNRLRDVQVVNNYENGKALTYWKDKTR